MMIEDLLDKEEISIGAMKFLISKIPAIQAQEIYGKVIKATDGVGDIGMTFLPIEVARKLLSYTAYKSDDQWLMLDEENRIQTFFPNLLTLIKLEAAMIRKNFGFLFDGSLPEVLDMLRGGDQSQEEPALP